MKKLKFEEGAVTPFWLKDLEYMQEGFEETVKAVIEGLSLGKKDVLVSGCKITTKNSKVSMTSGWCYFGGEILPVKALSETSYTGSGPKIKLTKKSGYDNNGSRPVQKETETITFVPYQNDYLEPSLLSNDFDTDCQLALCPGAWDLGTRIINKNQLEDTGIVRVINIDSAISSTLKYRQIGRVVQLYGSIGSKEKYSGMVTDTLPELAESITLNIGSTKVVIDGSKLYVYNLEGIEDLFITYLTNMELDSSSDGHYSMVGSGGNGGAESGPVTGGGTGTLG